MYRKANDNIHYLEAIVSRVCNGCKQDKPLADFHRKNIGKGGRVAVCRECHKAAYRADHPKKPRKPWTLKEKREYNLANADRHMYLRARARARLAGMQFNITMDDVAVPRFCPVLGIELVFGGGRGNFERGSSPSIDRIDNSKGYIKGNVIVVSDRANCIKRDATLLELQRIADFYTRLGAMTLLTEQNKKQ